MLLFLEYQNLSKSRYMYERPSEMENFISQMSALGIGKNDANLSTFDLTSLKRTIKDEFFWVVQLEHAGMVDQSRADVNPSKASGIGGVRATFMIYCYDDKGCFRIMQDGAGLPDSNTVHQ